ADLCHTLNEPFFKWIKTKRPWVTLKAAVTLDGRLASASGDARWVSGEASRRVTHQMRDAHDAILVGANTVRRDDPALTTRLGRGGRDPQRVILDGNLSIPAKSRALPGALIFAASTASRARENALRARGAEVVRLRGRSGRVDLSAVLDELGRRSIL